MESKVGVYSITCYGNEKFYIGSSINIQARRNSHFSQLRNGKHANKHLQNSFNKYGESSFYFDILEECKKETVLEVEQKWLDFLEPHCKHWGMNNSPTACNTEGFRHSVQTKEKLSELAKERCHTHLKEYAKSLIGKPSPRKGQPGKKWTEEERQRASLQRKGRVPWNRGVSPSPETLAKIKQYVKPSKYTEEQIKQCVDFQNAGKKLLEISDIAGIPISTVYRLVRTYEKKQGVTK